MSPELREKIRFPVELGGLSLTRKAANRYPYATTANNVRFRHDGGIERGPGWDVLYWSAALTGKIAVTASTAVVGSGTSFTTELAVGDQLYVVDTGEFRRITAITDNTNLTVSAAFVTADTSSDFKRSARMPATVEDPNGLFQLTRNDASTRYTIICTPTRIMTAPSTGLAWTTLLSGITGPGTNDLWDATTFNNELIMTVPGAGPYVTNGTAAGTGALVRTTYMQAMTALGTARTCDTGLTNLDDILYSATGGNATPTYTNRCEEYDDVANAWRTFTPSVAKRTQAGGFSAFGRYYVTHGATSATTLTNWGEYYNPAARVWTGAGTTTITSLRQVGTAGINNGGMLATGNDNATMGSEGSGDSSDYTASYDPATSIWTARTVATVAKRECGAFNIGHTMYLVGGVTATTVLTTGHYYDPFANTWTAMGALNTARKGAACVGSPNGYGYIFGGHNGTDPLATIERYDPIANTHSAVSTAVLATAKKQGGAGYVGYWLYVAGGQGAAINGQMDRFNSSPTPPQAHYCTSFKGHVFLARSSTYPSRVWYSEPGDAYTWPEYNYFDVNSDDGDWITGIFVFDNQLYVSKRDKIYRVIASIFAPDPEGDISYIPLTGTVGATNQKAICVTDHGVYYVAEDGFRYFDGQVSRDIGQEVAQDDTLMTLWTGGLPNMSQVVWDSRNSEVWFLLLSTAGIGTSIGWPVVYNYDQQKWSQNPAMYVNSTGALITYLRLLSAIEDQYDFSFVTGVFKGNYFPAKFTGDKMGNCPYFGSSSTSNGGNYISGTFYPAGVDKIASGASLELIFGDVPTNFNMSLICTNGKTQAFTTTTGYVNEGGTHIRYPLNDEMVGNGFRFSVGAPDNNSPYSIVGVIFHGHAAQQGYTSP